MEWAYKTLLAGSLMVVSQDKRLYTRKERIHRCQLSRSDETEAAIKGYFSAGCAYCGCRMTESGRGKVEMDHAVPISRGGGAGTENLRLCCHGDNAAKGPLTESEFKSLLALLDTWDPGAAQSLLVRLKGGYWCYRPTSARQPHIKKGEQMTARCKECGHTREANDAHFGISHYPFSRAHAFDPEIPDAKREKRNTAISSAFRPLEVPQAHTPENAAPWPL